MTYVDKTRTRVSAESAYLTPEVLARPNLTVAIKATATRILFETSAATGKPRAVGVEFGRAEGQKSWKARAKKEVIVSYVSFQPYRELSLTYTHQRRRCAFTPRMYVFYLDPSFLTQEFNRFSNSLALALRLNCSNMALLPLLTSLASESASSITQWLIFTSKTRVTLQQSGCSLAVRPTFLTPSAPSHGTRWASVVRWL